jgi:uncharacterized GH25 family protein
MLGENIIRIVNHEAWIEFDDRAYLRWGHYPETDGKLDPMSIRRAFVINPSREERAVAIGSDKASKGELFLEFDMEKYGIYTVVIEYDKGVYSITEDNKWIFGEKRYVAEMNYSVKESWWICGFAKAHIITGNDEEKIAAGLEFEIVPEIVKKFKEGDRVEVQLLFRGGPVKGRVNVRSTDRHTVIETDDNGFAEIELAKGVNVISARYKDEIVISGICDRRAITTTLTILVD